MFSVTNSNNMNNRTFNLSMASGRIIDDGSVGQPDNNNYRKNFKCLTCGKYFSSKHCLREHCFIHTGEKPYSCQVCQKIFKHASQLSMHKKTHEQRYELSYPKLTYLLTTYKTPKPEVSYLVEQILLPALSGPQALMIPKLKIVED